MWCCLMNPCCLPCLLWCPLPSGTRAAQVQEELTLRLKKVAPEAFHKLSGWFYGNLSLFFWQPPRPDLADGEQEEEVQAKVKEAIVGSSLEAMQRRLEAQQLFDEKKTYYGPPRGWMLTFTMGLTELVVWSLPFFYFLLQVLSILFFGESLLATLSSELDSVRSTGSAFLVHLFSSAFMWLLVVLPRDRHQVWAERATGLFLLLTWMLASAPAAMLLSFFEGVGSARFGQLSSLIYTVTFADCTVFATFFFYRAWRIGRTSHADKVQHHETAMMAGLFFSLMPSVQHILVALELCFHGCFKACLAMVPSSWEACHFWAHLLESAVDVLLEPHRVRAYVALMAAVYWVMCMDGPRTSLIQEGFKMRETAVIEFFGSKGPGRLERGLWRARPLIYLLIRCYATSGFTEDPALALNEGRFDFRRLHLALE
ncbi:unnamed protein product [Effrenium voratum]|nr:unnamed protein product [Effrenium voratum]